jgi:hypothetical protein
MENTMQALTRSICCATALAAALILMPTTLVGQEIPELPQQQCTAELSPAAVPAGSDAVRIMATLSEDVGAVTGVEGTEESGIAMASPMDMPRTEMAVAGGQPQPIQMGAGENAWALWLNTSGAEPGDHRIRIIADGGVCEAPLSITPNS